MQCKCTETCDGLHQGYPLLIVDKKVDKEMFYCFNILLQRQSGESIMFSGIN